MDHENQLKSMNDILTEKELIDLLGLKKAGLDRLRHDEGFPFCKVSHRDRIYLVRDVLAFIEGKRVILNRGVRTEDNDGI